MITIARNVKFSFLRGGGSALEVLYGKVSLTPTNLHTLSSTAVLPAPTTFDLVNGTALATNVAPTPAPVDGTIAWGYKVKITDNFGKSWEYLVGVPDGTTEINFNVLPRYSETRPPAFGVGPAGPAGQSATIAIGTTSSGTTPTVTNSGTSTNAILDFILPKGDKGDTGAPGSGVNFAYDPTGTVTPYATPPLAYPNGVTEGLYHRALGGWPNLGGATFNSVTTFRHTTYPQGSFQIIRGYQRDVMPLIRFGLAGDIWSATRELASADIATVSVNGLLSAADKAKLDGMTPAANTKTFAALASTYQTGFSTLQVRAEDGWPIASTAQVVTFKTSAGAANTAQWIYPVEGTTPQFRIATSATGNPWESLQTLATKSYVDANATGVNVKAFGATGDGVTTDSTAIYAALEAATALGLPLDIPKGHYKMSGFMDIPSGAEIRMSPGCVLDFSGSGATYHLAARGALGTPLNIGTLTRGSRVLTIPASGLMANTWIRINSDDVYDPSSTSTTLGELVQVQTVVGTQVTLHSPLQDTYTTNVRMYPITPVENIVISGGTIRGNYVANAGKTGIYMRLVVNGQINGTKTEGIDRAHVSIIDCVNVWATKTRHTWAKSDSMAYGISFADCTRGSGATQGTYSDVRHSLSTNNSSSVGGIVRDITFSYNTIQYSALAVAGGSGGDAIDTHTAAEDIRILYNTVLGSSLQGINFEGSSGIIEGNTVRNTAGTGISVHNESARRGNIIVRGNNVQFTSGLGIYVRAGNRGGTTTRYESVIVSDNYVSNVTSTGIRVGFVTDLSERSVVVANNSVTRAGNRGMMFTLIDGLSTSGNVVTDCVGGGILYDRVTHGSLGPDTLREVTVVEGTPSIGVECISVTRSALRPGAIRATGTGARGVKLHASCAEMSVLGTTHIFATTKVENLASPTSVVVSN